MKIFRNTAVFVIVYLLGMLPTYILPYFGSNSLFINAVAAAVGYGLSPQTWAHLWSLAFLISITWARGPFAGRGYLVIFPVLAAAFDMIPFLSMIPFVPTVMHILAIVLGAIVKTSAAEDICIASCKKALYMLATVTVVAIAGTILFVTTISVRTAAAQKHSINTLETFTTQSSSSASNTATSSASSSVLKQESSSSSAATIETETHSEATSSSQVESQSSISPQSSVTSSKTAKPQPKAAATRSRKTEHPVRAHTAADKKHLQETNDMLDDLLKN